MTDDGARHILVANFNTRGGAALAVDQLKTASIKLGNVALVVRDEDGEVEFTETQDWGVGKSALVGAIAGLLLPGVGTITLAAGGALAAYFLDLGFPDTLLKQLGEGLTVNSSMVVAVVDGASTGRATELVAAGGGTVLGTGQVTGQDSDLAAVLETIRRPS